MPEHRNQSLRAKALRRLQTPAMLLFFSIAPSCNDPVRPAQFSVPKYLPAVLVSAARLRTAAQKTLILGDRVALLADSSAAATVNAALVEPHDTNIVSIDASGMLFARAIGKSWVVWPRAGERDSVLLSVAPIGQTGNLEQDFNHPTLPQLQVDVRYPTGRTRTLPAEKSWRVDKGGDLQGALNAAQPGDEIVLATGSTFVGNYVLPNKSGGSGWIVVRAEEMHTPAGTRISPASVSGSASVITPNQDPAIKTAPGAHRWRLVGFEVGHQTGAIYNYGILVLGRGDEPSLALQPSEIVLDRMYVHGSATDGASRCITFNGRSLAVVDSWISECHAKGADAQGVGGWSGAGPFLIENNRIEASGQAVMFGGGDPQIANVTPSDIIIRRNYMFKPLSWAHGRWTVKATFELKHARRVLFEANVLENHWADAQTGFPILFQAVSQDNGAPWSTVRDVTVQNNLIKNCPSGVNMLARYNALLVTPTSRIAVVNNLFQDVGIDPISGGQGRIFQLLGELEDVTVLHNTTTLSPPGKAGQAVGLDGAPSTRLIFADNVLPMTDYGMFGNAVGSGIVAFTTYAPGAVVTGNVIPNQPANVYPPFNYFPDSGPSSGPGTTTGSAACSAVKLWLQGRGFGTAAGAECEVLSLNLRNVVEGLPQ